MLPKTMKTFSEDDDQFWRSFLFDSCYTAVGTKSSKKRWNKFLLLNPFLYLPHNLILKQTLKLQTKRYPVAGDSSLSWCAILKISRQTPRRDSKLKVLSTTSEVSKSHWNEFKTFVREKTTNQKGMYALKESFKTRNRSENEWMAILDEHGLYRKCKVRAVLTDVASAEAK